MGITWIFSINWHDWLFPPSLLCFLPLVSMSPYSSGFLLPLWLLHSPLLAPHLLTQLLTQRSSWRLAPGPPSLFTPHAHRLSQLTRDLIPCTNGSHDCTSLLSFRLCPSAWTSPESLEFSLFKLDSSNPGSLSALPLSLIGCGYQWLAMCHPGRPTRNLGLTHPWNHPHSNSL